MVRNLVAICPLVKVLKTYIISVKYLFKNKKLKIGYNVTLNKVIFGYSNCVGNDSVLTRVKVGDFTYFSSNCIFRDVTIGKFCSIGPNVKAGLGYHPTDKVSIHPSFYSNEKQVPITFSKKMEYQDHRGIKIGNDVWIGANVILLDGIIVGNGAIIGAGSVVTKNVNEYEIVGGVPAKKIRSRFSDEIKFKIKETEWWNWTIPKLKREAKFFNDVEEFLNSNGKA